MSEADEFASGGAHDETSNPLHEAAVRWGAKDVRYTQQEPHDELTRLCDIMKGAMIAHPDCPEEGIRAIIMLDTGKRAGIHWHGYEDDITAISDLTTHLAAMLEPYGKTLYIVDTQ